jgi:hypothetical protein
MRHSDEQYVAHPGHPFYGHGVRVLQRWEDQTRNWCLIEDPAHPGFHYQILERWLTVSPPTFASESILQPNHIALPLRALDRLVQMIVAKDQIWRAEDGQVVGRGRDTDLGPTAGGEENAPE